MQLARACRLRTRSWTTERYCSARRVNIYATQDDVNHPKVFFRFCVGVNTQPSERCHQPAAGPMKRTVNQNSTRAPIPIQAPRVVRLTNWSA